MATFHLGNAVKPDDGLGVNEMCIRDSNYMDPHGPAHVGEPKRFPEISDAAYQFPGETDIVE